MIFNFFELGFFIDLRAPSVPVPRKTTARRARGHGEFSAARARGDTIRTFCGSSVKFYFFMIFYFSIFRFFVFCFFIFTCIRISALVKKRRGNSSHKWS